MRSLLKSLVHVSGVGIVITADDGSETIKSLKKVGHEPFKGGANTIAIIMC